MRPPFVLAYTRTSDCSSGRKPPSALAEVGGRPVPAVAGERVRDHVCRAVRDVLLSAGSRGRRQIHVLCLSSPGSGQAQLRQLVV